MQSHGDPQAGDQHIAVRPLYNFPASGPLVIEVAHHDLRLTSVSAKPQSHICARGRRSLELTVHIGRGPPTLGIKRQVVDAGPALCTLRQDFRHFRKWLHLLTSSFVTERSAFSSV